MLNCKLLIHFNTAVLATLLLPFYTSEAQTVTFLGGNMALDSSWDTGLRPTTDETGIIDVDGEIVVGNNLGQWMTGDPSLVFGGDATIFATNVSGVTDFDPPGATNGDGDFGGTAVGSFTINNATIIARDDIFSNSSVMTFNTGSMATAADDFEANGLSTLNINGGTHSAGDVFGAQSGGNNFGTLNLAGGSITAGQFRVENDGNEGIVAVMNILAGDATLSGGGSTATLLGDINVFEGWTGSWTITTLAGTDWETAVTAGNWTLNGFTVDSTVFADNFQVTNSGQTLSINEELILPGLIGDFNGDMMVDLADYTIWRNNLGADETVLPAGSFTPGNGTVDEEEYTAWKGSFGASSGGIVGLSAASVPEPSTILLTGIAAFGLLTIQIRKK